MHKQDTSQYLRELVAGDSAEFKQINDVLNSGFRWLRFPAQLEQEYHEYYRQETLTILRAQTINIFLAYFISVITLFSIVPVSSMGMYPEIIATCSAVVLLMGGVGNSGYLEKYVFHALFFSALLTITIVMIGVPSVLTSTMHDIAVAGCNLLVCAIYALSRLRLWQAMLASLLSGPLFLLFYFLIEVPVDKSLLLGIYLSPNLIGVTIGYFVEHRERTVFLQDKQILIEKQRLAELTEKLDALSKTDGLTQLYNRRYFDEVIHTEWERAKRYQESIGLLLIDVDHFKPYNDYYGHPAGDKVLVKVAQALRNSSCRVGDLVARFGGEEFVVLLPKADVAGCEAVAERIHDALKELDIEHKKSQVSDRVTASIGVSVCIPENDLRYVELIEQADVALYRAKEQGRSQTVTFESGMAA